MSPQSDPISYMGGDKHKLVAQTFANYISFTPALDCHPYRFPVPLPPPDETLDIYIAHVIHLCKVPEIVPYAACYLFVSISQPCQCKNRRVVDQSFPSKLSHVLSRAVTRTAFPRLSKSRRSDHHFFAGALYYALLAYKDILSDKGEEELRCWEELPLLCGISEGEIMAVAIAFKPYVTPELQMTIKSMMEDGYVRDAVEVDCPFVHAHRERLLKARDAKEKGSIDSVWKPVEKTTRIV